MTDAVTAFAPGRVNLIGEHTDYNDGLALPFAIADGVTVRARRCPEDRIQIHAVDLDAHDGFALRDPARVGGWRAFGRGAVAELTDAGCELVGARLVVSGSVPRGSGLSSSAALEVAMCLALLGVADAEPPDRLSLARICSRVENEWVGAQTGLLDQMASLFGEAGRAMRIDFRSLEVSPVPLKLDGFSLVTLDSGQRHANARGGGSDTPSDADSDSHSDSDSDSDSEAGYNERRRECARACERLGLKTLRDATEAMADRLPDPLSARVRHVVSENARVRKTVDALGAGDLARVGELLNASHASLRDDYEVSTPAVEQTVSRLRAAGAIGARIMGGGFGGHVLGLLPPGAVPPEGAIRVTPGAGAGLRR